MAKQVKGGSLATVEAKLREMVEQYDPERAGLGRELEELAEQVKAASGGEGGKPSADEEKGSPIRDIFGAETARMVEGHALRGGAALIGYRDKDGRQGFVMADNIVQIRPLGGEGPVKCLLVTTSGLDVECSQSPQELADILCAMTGAQQGSVADPADAAREAVNREEAVRKQEQAGGGEAAAPEEEAEGKGSIAETVEKFEQGPPPGSSLPRGRDEQKGGGATFLPPAEPIPADGEAEAEAETPARKGGRKGKSDT